MNLIMKFDNKWLYKIVGSSEILDAIMEDIEKEAPEIIKVSNKKEVRKTLINYICHPSPFKTYHSSTVKLIRILKRHLSDTKEFSAFEKVASGLRSKLYHAVKKLNISENFMELLGCTSDELTIHLENQFTAGMSWDNHGIKGWHIDHIEPLCSFILTDPNQVRKATHYTNLRPLGEKKNDQVPSW